ncbi:MAG TPA: ornithine carbamoyltransferase [Thermoplasmata archaeon]|jgi:ornithine carbamoyltransferase|nr:ornithine carbamoyltransferase [Thermoplasmata archaeon]
MARGFHRPENARSEAERPPRPPKERDLLSISDIARELPSLLEAAEKLKRLRAEQVFPRSLQDRNVAMVFENPSTSLRSSFEVAVQDMGGHAVYLSHTEIQSGREGRIADSARVLSRYYDAIVYRAHHWQDGVELARWANVPVINALDDRERPCQVVADLLTLKERWRGRFRDRRLAYLGDGNSLLNSLVLGCAIVGLDLVAAIPEGHRPTDSLLAEAAGFARGTGASTHIVADPKEAARDADAIYIDGWAPREEEAEEARCKVAFRGYTLDEAMLNLAHPGAFAMHDLPAQRGREITDAVMDGPRQALWDQAENRLHAQKAILELLMRPRGD